MSFFVGNTCMIHSNIEKYAYYEWSWLIFSLLLLHFVGAHLLICLSCSIVTIRPRLKQFMDDFLWKQYKMYHKNHDENHSKMSKNI